MRIIFFLQYLQWPLDKNPTQRYDARAELYYRTWIGNTELLICGQFFFSSPFGYLWRYAAVHRYGRLGSLLSKVHSSVKYLEIMWSFFFWHYADAKGRSASQITSGGCNANPDIQTWVSPSSPLWLGDKLIIVLYVRLLWMIHFPFPVLKSAHRGHWSTDKPWLIVGGKHWHYGHLCVSLRTCVSCVWAFVCARLRWESESKKECGSVETEAKRVLVWWSHTGNQCGIERRKMPCPRVGCTQSCTQTHTHLTRRERGRDVLSAKTKRNSLIMRNEQKIRQVGAQC